MAGAALATGVYGVKKGVDAKSDHDSAKHWNERAEELYDNAKTKLESKREKAQTQMKTLGKTKFGLYKNSIVPFVETFSLIKAIDFDDESLIDSFGLPNIDRAEMLAMEESVFEIKQAVTGGMTALGSGGLAGLAAYGGVGTFGAASTGTAIGSLSGAAATNATLAWLGGGSLASGGFGMAGGMAVLGGVVAGPVLAVGGMMLASKAEAAKHDAYANFDKAELAAEEMKSAGVATDGIGRRFREINKILVGLNERFIPLLNSLQDLVEENKDYQMYSEENKKLVFLAASTAKVLKTIMESPIIDKKGSLTKESRKAVTLGKTTLSKSDS
ncbi:hypothetical protein [Alkalimarinus coralli]|uniref:hypothetical protein n=1 Tax=Alkalimarinus coralli TaxID=2935863 RepID=UPI00202B02D6|nr:hypothetical protein [Alkalimarinus coralli]